MQRASHEQRETAGDGECSSSVLRSCGCLTSEKTISEKTISGKKPSVLRSYAWRKISGRHAAMIFSRLRAPPLLRPEDPDRDLFLPLLDLLDFLAAAMGRLRVGGFVERIARFAHNNTNRHRTMLHLMQHRNPHD
jgi:hypothetical protein